VQRRIKRSVAAAVGCVLLAGIGIGAVMVRDARVSRFDVVSRWSSGGARIESGSLGTDPERGFVRWTPGRRKSLLFTTPEGAGALRLISHSSYRSKFRSSSGALVLFSPEFNSGFEDRPPSFQFLGRQLDPAKLGRIGPRGVAVVVDLSAGKKLSTAVVLVEQTPGRHGSFGNGWKVDGYLPGFSTPSVAAWQKSPVGSWRETVRQLQQPLVGPDGRSYAIDAKDGRLVRIGSTPRATLWRYKLGGCTTWPGAHGASYRACTRAITLHKAHEAPVTILRRDPRDQLDIYNTAWTFLQPSPDGRWLLLEGVTEACSVASWAEFMPARGGPFSLVFPGSGRSSEALGWLPDNTALVQGQPQVCGGSGTEGIYQVRPGPAGSPLARQLVFPTALAADETAWGIKP
jgi:hypothetical protein